MKNCTDCKHAEWKRTASGKLHPSGDGRCRYPYKVPPLPASMRWYLDRADFLAICAAGTPTAKGWAA